MIVTLTANPSLDRTIELGEPLIRGAVQRAERASSDPGGKGVNVARVVTAAGGLAVAILPTAVEDPCCWPCAKPKFPSGPRRSRIRYGSTSPSPSRTATTKINEPGSGLDSAVLDSLTEQLCREARAAALGGAVRLAAPRGVDLLVRRTHRGPARRGLPDRVGHLRASVERGTGPRKQRPADLVNPNAGKLAEVTDQDATAIEADPHAAVRPVGWSAGRPGVRTVLATLGSRGAVLVTPEGAWQAMPPPITARSAVGSGDSALAGHLVADVDGHSPPERLRQAVAYGAAAASVPSYPARPS